MIAAVHALIGSTLARSCTSRTTAALLGAASHPVADMLPHRDLEIPQEAALLAGALTLIAAVRGSDSLEFAGALGAVLPDVENLVGRVFALPEEKLLLPTHNHYHGRKVRDFSAQLALAAAGLVSLLLSPDRCDEVPERGTSSRDLNAPKPASVG